jgi:hypothetical protein
MSKVYIRWTYRIFFELWRAPDAISPFAIWSYYLWQSQNGNVDHISDVQLLILLFSVAASLQYCIPDKWRRTRRISFCARRRIRCSCVWSQRRRSWRGRHSITRGSISRQGGGTFDHDRGNGSGRRRRLDEPGRVWTLRSCEKLVRAGGQHVRLGRTRDAVSTISADERIGA